MGLVLGLALLTILGLVLLSERNLLTVALIEARTVRAHPTIVTTTIPIGYDGDNDNDGFTVCEGVMIPILRVRVDFSNVSGDLQPT